MSRYSRHPPSMTGFLYARDVNVEFQRGRARVEMGSSLPSTVRASVSSPQSSWSLVLRHHLDGHHLSPPALSTSQRQFAIHLQVRAATSYSIPTPRKISGKADNLTVTVCESREERESRERRSADGNGNERKRENDSWSTVSPQKVSLIERFHGWVKQLRFCPGRRFTASWFFNQRRPTVVSYSTMKSVFLKIGKCRGGRTIDWPDEWSKLLIYK